MNTNIPFLWDKKLFASTGKHDCASDITDSNVAQSGLALAKKKGAAYNVFILFLYRHSAVHASLQSQR